MTLTLASFPRYGLRTRFAEGRFITFAEFFCSTILLTFNLNNILIIITIKIILIFSLNKI